MKFFFEIINKYYKFFPIAFAILAFLRVGETVLVLMNHHIEGLLIEEFYGLILDIPVMTVFLFMLFPIFLLIFIMNEKIANWFMHIAICLFSVVQLLILQYYSYFLIPLNHILHANTINEIIYTIRTSDAPKLYISLWIAFIITTITIYIYLIPNKMIKAVQKIVTFAGLVISFLLLVFSEYVYTPHTDPVKHYVRKNKSVIFYKSILTNDNSKKNISPDNEAIKAFHDDNKLKVYFSSQYPLLNEDANSDLLGSFFIFEEQPPNIILIIIEGLGSHFIDTFKGTKFMAFLDSLKNQSLYWPNCLASSERSFGAIPTLTGSLPHGTKGFTFIEPIPNHFSLVNVLKQNSYRTVYFYGQGAWFHRKDHFLRKNQIDLIVDNSNFPEHFEKVLVGKNNFFWGYHDKDLFSHSMQIIDTIINKPMFYIYFTGTTHSPFFLPNHFRYDVKIDSILNLLNNKADKKYIQSYRKYLKTILFADDALNNFFEKYSSHPDFKNTIFIITGDHPMTEVPVTNWLKRYQVPLVIYSPMLKETKRFPPVVSHFDLLPTMTGLLRTNFNFSIPSATQAIGIPLDTSSYFRNLHPITMMNTDRQIKDYFFDKHYLVDGTALFNVDSLLNLSIINNPQIIADYKNRLQRFIDCTTYASLNNKLVPDSLFLSFNGFIHLASKENNNIEIKSDNEYFNFVESFFNEPLSEVYLSGEITGISSTNLEDAPSLILQVTDYKGQSLLWEPISISFNEITINIQHRFIIDNKGKAPFRIALYFWNPKNGDLAFSEASISLYRSDY
jgi:uncharacterized sulfatase